MPVRQHLLSAYLDLHWPDDDDSPWSAVEESVHDEPVDACRLPDEVRALLEPTSRTTTSRRRCVRSAAATTRERRACRSGRGSTSSPSASDTCPEPDPG